MNTFTMDMANAELRTRGMTVNELATEVKRRAETMEDFISDTRRLGFVVDPEAEHKVVLSLDSPDADNELLDLPVNDYAQHQIAGRLAIPYRFWERMRNDHPDILQDTVRKLFVREPKVQMVRALDGYARAFLSNRYRRLDYFDLMERSVLPALAEDDSVHVFSCAITDRRLYMKVIFPDVTVEVTPGDPLSCGIVISNSEVGSGRLYIEPFTYRWACSNGMIMGQKAYSDFGLSKMHVGRAIEDNDQARAMFTDATLALEDETFYAMAYDTIIGAKTGIQFASIANRMRELAGIKVEGNPLAAVQKLAKTHDLTEGESESILTHLAQGGDLTAWGYVNAITRAAQDVPDYDRSTDLERLAGNLTDLTSARWEALVAV